MKTDKLKEEFALLAYSEDGKIPKNIWNWINQNYIPKEDVEGLKIELNKISSNSANYFCDVVAVEEINQKITNLLNK